MPTFVDAVRTKYEHKEGSTEGGELVGGDKTGKKQALDQLTRVYVEDAAIDAVGGDGEVAAVCGAIRELDLAGNKFTSWEPVLAIATQLPKLGWLGLDRLTLAPLGALPDNFGAGVGGLKTLCLSGTGMAWEQMLFLSTGLPQLEELHFSRNGVASLRPADPESAPTLLRSVRELSLEGNALSSWADVTPILAQLPRLELLNLNYNQLVELPPNPPGADAGFVCLRHLMLRGNPLNDWASIDALDSFPALTEARLAELPLTKAMSGAASRRVVIARLGKLRGLNGSEVRTREREDAERFYLREVAREYPEGGLPEGAVVEAEGAAAAEAQQVDEYGRPVGGGGGGGGGGKVTLTVPEGEEWASLVRRHPRWKALLVHHGTHVTRSTSTNSSGVMDLVEVTLRATSAEAAHLPPQTRKLPGGLPLKSIKLIASQLFKVDPTKIQMLYCPPGQDKDIPEELDDDTRSLGDMGVVSGGTIVIEEKD